MSNPLLTCRLAICCQASVRTFLRGAPLRTAEGFNIGGQSYWSSLQLLGFITLALQVCVLLTASLAQSLPGPRHTLKEFAVGLLSALCVAK